jgi:hypothetical protein
MDSWAQFFPISDKKISSEVQSMTITVQNYMNMFKYSRFDVTAVSVH